ncbi:flagellin [Quadrisphaera granulorum]|uniref:Flagellin n=1 Tax=Quadrisphaera granulorum TaxID=317664 RepID=A0A316A4X9_9ACTN|nr:flagellin [Quadrisphaera granulorum]PWJ52613.1 flagellin [Quadrisphaera granulorum]SZE97663.1 flagellin [Quadrisphaera granulorum]
MALTVNSNIQALNAYRNLNKTQAGLSSSLEKLSSGLRINRAADDAAGLAISEGLKAQIGGIQQASHNAQDAISLVQTGDGALATTHAVLQRLRTLAMQAANGSQSSNSREAINEEATALKAELTRIANTTSFNNVNLLDGTFNAGAGFQVGYRGDNAAMGATGNVVMVAIGSGAVAASATTASLAGASVTAASSVAFNFSANALTVSVKVDGVAKTLTVSGNLGTSTNLVTNATGLAASLNTALTSAYGAPVAVFTTGANGAITLSASTTGSHIVEITAVSGGTTNAASVGLSTGLGLGQSAVAAGSFDAGGLGVAGVWLSDQTNAQSSLSAIDAAITTVSLARARLGALQNRFQYTVDNLDTAAENLSAGLSRIADTDMAAQMVSFTRAQILSQSGTAMLSQAKNLPASILELLKN